MKKIILNKNKKAIFIILFIIINIFTIQTIAIKKFILFNKLKNEFKLKNNMLYKKIENYDNYNKNMNEILKCKNIDDLYLVELKDLYNIILNFNNNLKLKYLNKDKIEIGYKELVEKYKNKDIIKIPIKIQCSGKYNNLIEYIEYLESINKFITIDNIILNLKNEENKIETEKFDLELCLSILALEE